jgi:hypothetical protein
VRRESVRLDPRTVALTLQSTPGGLQLTLNGVTAASSFTRTVIMGSKNSISAPTPQTVKGATYVFSSWSDGGAQAHDIIANQTTTYKARYQRSR